jgi:hypothetical protein
MRRGERPRLASETTQRRRVTVVARRSTAGVPPHRHWTTQPTRRTAADMVAVLQALPRHAPPLIVVLDTAGRQRRTPRQDATAGRWARGISRS